MKSDAHRKGRLGAISLRLPLLEQGRNPLLIEVAPEDLDLANWCRPVGPLTVILNTEAAAAFDDLTRAGIRDGIGKWGTTFRQGQFVPAVEYLRACRIRTLVMREMEAAVEGVDAYVGGDDLVLTNFTGHPTVILPDGERKDSKSGQPGTLTFTGRLFGESKLLALALAYQEASGAHLKRPPLELMPAEKEEKSP